MKKKWLIYVLSSLIVVLAASTTMSVAWYATSDFLRVDDINITLNGSGELLIATKDEPTAYKSHLEYKDLKPAGLFDPVTSMMESNWMKDKKEKPTPKSWLPIKVRLK